MTTSSERIKKLEEAKASLKGMVDFDLDTLARTSELGTQMDFAAAVPNLRILKGIFKELDSRDLSRLSTDHLNSISGICKTIKSDIEMIINFKVEGNTNPSENRKQIIERIDREYDGVMSDRLMTILTFTATQSTDVAHIEMQAKELLAKMKDESAKFNEMLQRNKKDADSALDAIKQIAQQSGAATNATIYSDAAKAFRNASRWWLGATLFSLVVAVGIVLHFLTKFLEPNAYAAIKDSTVLVISVVANKIILLSLLSFLVYWCSKNYKSNKHNQIANEHRAQSLMSFRAFVEGAFDDSIKQTILMQAANAAFANRSTGYDTADNDLHCVNPVVEILGKSIPSNGK